MRWRRGIVGMLTAAMLAGGGLALKGCGGGGAFPANAAAVEEAVRIRPNYAGVTIPPNIAPLNFRVLQAGERYCVRISGDAGEAIVVESGDGAIRIPPADWRRLLEANAGGALTYEAALCDENGDWRVLIPFRNEVAAEPIDSHVAYRRLKPQYNYWRDVGVYQRDLTTFDESLVLHGRSYANGCVNCHSFCNNDPKQMFLAIRSREYGSSSVLQQDGELTKVGTTFGHTSWHPSGRLAAYSVYDVRMFFHTARTEIRDLVEFDSLVACYRLDRENVETTPALADKRHLETQPSWSADGKYLYFASNPVLWEDKERFPPDEWAQLLYDIKRVSYDIETDTWGDVETVIASKDTGKSCLAPRMSFDGRFLLFTMCDYSCFMPCQPSADLYVMEMATGQIRRLECNSEWTESWHGWSTNDRWIVFASKRPTGKFTHLYFSYIDEEGRASKPFLLPQEDPDFYESYLYLYNVPELITGPIPVGPRELARVVRSDEKIAVDAVTGASPKKTVPLRPE